MDHYTDEDVWGFPADADADAPEQTPARRINWLRARVWLAVLVLCSLFWGGATCVMWAWVRG